MSFNHFHQSVEDIIKSANPEQKIVWNYLFLRFGENISISQFYFFGSWANTSTAVELNVYSSRKLYFIYEMTYKLYNSIGNTSRPEATVYNESNVGIISLNNSIIYWNTTTAAPNYLPVERELKNIVFSRITGNVATDNVYGWFKGFRIGI